MFRNIANILFTRRINERNKKKENLKSSQSWFGKIFNSKNIPIENYQLSYGVLAELHKALDIISSDKPSPPPHVFIF